MKKIKTLNLYAGIGGNRKLWPEYITFGRETYKIEVTAIEINPEIAKIYKDLFPNDKVIVADAHQYLLDHYKEFDFIWSSPPCPTHSKIRYLGFVTGEIKEAKYPDMKLYEEVIFLSNFCKNKFVVENVKGFYEPLVKPQQIGRHYFWSNFIIPRTKVEVEEIRFTTLEEKQKQRGFYIDNYKNVDKTKILRNCVNSKLGLHIFNCAFKEKQQTLK